MKTIDQILEEGGSTMTAKEHAVATGTFLATAMIHWGKKIPLQIAKEILAAEFPDKTQQALAVKSYRLKAGEKPEDGEVEESTDSIPDQVEDLDGRVSDEDRDAFDNAVLDAIADVELDDDATLGELVAALSPADQKALLATLSALSYEDE